jgi:hypothetical protein
LDGLTQINVNENIFYLSQRRAAMKYTTDMKKAEFTPITITITIENLAELKSMWARMGENDDFEGCDPEPEAEGAYIDCYDIWNELDEILKKYL